MAVDIYGYVSFEVEREGRKYRYSVPMGSPFIESHEVCLEIAQRIADESVKEAERNKQANSQPASLDAEIQS
jgi:hypothetical protein